MIPGRDFYEGILMTNPSWTNGCPGLPGKDYQECLAAWNLKKTITLRKIYKDLGELYAQDDELGTATTGFLVNVLKTANWQAPCGTWPVWAGIFSRSKNMANKQLTGKTDLDQLSGGVFKNGKGQKTTGAVPERTRIQDTATGLGGRAERLGSNDALEGRR